MSALETDSAERRKDRLWVGNAQRVGTISNQQQYLFDGMAAGIGHDANISGSRPRCFAWFKIELARLKILKSQLNLLDQLEQTLASSG